MSNARNVKCKWTFYVSNVYVLWCLHTRISQIIIKQLCSVWRFRGVHGFHVMRRWITCCTLAHPSDASVHPRYRRKYEKKSAYDVTLKMVGIFVREGAIDAGSPHARAYRAVNRIWCAIKKLAFERRETTLLYNYRVHAYVIVGKIKTRESTGYERRRLSGSDWRRPEVCTIHLQCHLHLSENARLLYFFERSLFSANTIYNTSYPLKSAF